VRLPESDERFASPAPRTTAVSSPCLRVAYRPRPLRRLRPRSSCCRARLRRSRTPIRRARRTGLQASREGVSALGRVLDHRLRLPFGFRLFAHRSTSGRFQTRVARSRAIGSGKSGSPVKRIAFRRVVRRSSATSARPRRFLPSAAIPSKMVSQRKCPAPQERPGATRPTATGTSPGGSQRVVGAQDGSTGIVREPGRPTPAARRLRGLGRI
jgi:hypothetical protein